MRISDRSSDVCSSDLSSDGSKNWAFDIVGVLHNADDADGGWNDQLLLLHYKYFEESTPYVEGDVGWYVGRVADVSQADRIAAAIDALSKNSDHETKTMTEQAATANWMKQMADISLIGGSIRSEEHTSELQSLMRNQSAVFC